MKKSENMAKNIFFFSYLSNSKDAFYAEMVPTFVLQSRRGDCRRVRAGGRFEKLGIQIITKGQNLPPWNRTNLSANY